MTKPRRERETTLRTETISVRLSPRLRYLARIAAQRQLRPISSFVEWAVEQGLAQVTLRPDRGTVADYANYLWDVDEIDRFVNLALGFPELLNHEEQLIWRVIKSNRYFWDQKASKVPEILATPPIDGVSRRMGDRTSQQCPNNDRIRKYWTLIRDIAHGKASLDALPSPEEASFQPEAIHKKPRSSRKED